MIWQNDPTQSGHAMRQLTSIVAVNREGVIGCRNALPWRIKSDMAFFKATTACNVVVMGRKTFDSLGRCLPNRYNVILSHQFQLFGDQPECVLRTGLFEGLAEAEAAPKQFKEIFIIGGATMYTQFDPIVDRYLITVVDKKVDCADAFFDIGLLDRSEDWYVARLTKKSQGDGDEAPFEIFELRSRHKEERQIQRAKAVAEIVNKQGARNSRKRQSVGGVSVGQTHASFW